RRAVGHACRRARGEVLTAPIRPPSSLVTPDLMNSSAADSRHAKLYVVCQTAGWLAWMLAYIGLGQLQRSLTSNGIWIGLAINLIGWLLSHLYRVFINARGWK